ncbi:Crp/FNR family transcriptional regulator [Caballeronia terrestris]|jgi:CRP-like cAMP-binding protein|uniref:Crp/FNR family transcriptional regulator n=1 Tax=Caballeronia terrestris TaxID=1226301 RepID=A0A158ITM4_9BURK|nr:Crp/Fnr family transcriptional regulator [Caballeronia terrestris]SAL60032.1 Crp/FNR family transcriptional regulator [Caballeronia terrestris]
MLTLQSDLHGNHLLSGLPTQEWKAIAPDLELVRLESSQVLCDAGARVRHIYFPITAVVSLLHTMEDGRSVEVASIGREGTTGANVLMNGDAMPSNVEVQCSGSAYRVDAAALRQHFDRSEAMRRLIMLYAHALFTKIAQTAACNRHHSVSNQFSRWLLEAMDATGTDKLVITQQRIADLLGVRREAVTEAAGRLQSAGIVYQTRGSIRIVDRSGLEGRACECYGLVKREFARLLPAMLAEEAA